MSKGLLQPKQRQRLENLAVSDGHASLQDGARVLLAQDTGQEAGEIAESVGLSVDAVRDWQEAFRKNGMAIFSNEVDPPPAIITTPSITIDQLRAQYYKSGQQDKKHAQNLAITLFDQTRQIHHLNDDHRRLLTAAVLLHDLTAPQNVKTYHKTTHKLILSHALVDFSTEELKMLAAMVRYQRGKVKRRAISEFVSASPLLTNEILILIALLRIVLGLDHSQSQKTQIQALQVTPEMLHIVIRGPHAASDAGAAQKNAKLWAKVCHQSLIVEPVDQTKHEIQKASENLPYPALMKKAGIGSWDPMAEAGRKVLRYYFAEMMHNEAGAIQGEDIEALHDMRVATRRMRAAFEVFGDAYEPEAIKPYMTGLRMAGRALGPVRDLDVFMEKAQHYQASPIGAAREGLEPLTHAWQEERGLARIHMIEHLASHSYNNFKQQFNVFLHTPGAAARPITKAKPYLVCQVAPILVYSSLAVVRSYESILSSPSIDQLHELRIAFKRLRYTVGFFQEVLGPEAEIVNSEIKHFQDHLGDLNDADVACRILSGFLEQWEKRQGHLPLKEREDPEPVAAYLATKHAERHHLMVSFQDAWAAFVHPSLRQNLAKAVSVL